MRAASPPLPLSCRAPPPTSFFNQPTVTRHTSPTVHYSVQITLSPSAALDARQVNQYTLTLEATCPGETPANGQLFVQVHTVDGPPQCMARFASQVGELVQVPEDVAPLTPIHTVVLRRPASGLRPLSPWQFTIEDNDTPLTIDHTGQVLAPGSGFIPAHAGQVSARVCPCLGSLQPCLLRVSPSPPGLLLGHALPENSLSRSMGESGPAPLFLGLAVTLSQP
ncbi:hypothetical protein KIL84_000439, partial [Mauremys mutica]